MLYAAMTPLIYLYREHTSFFYDISEAMFIDILEKTLLWFHLLLWPLRGKRKRDPVACATAVAVIWNGASISTFILLVLNDQSNIGCFNSFSIYGKSGNYRPALTSPSHSKS